MIENIKLGSEIDSLMKKFVDENGNSLREVLQETDDFLWSSIQKKKWTYRDMEYIHDIVLFILSSEIKRQEKEDKNITEE